MPPRLAPPRPISPDDRTENFRSGKEPLDRFLRERALANEGQASRTYVVCAVADGEPGAVIAYYTLAAGAVARADAPGPLRRNMPDPLPVMVLGRLAVDRRWAGQGLGTAMLREAMQRVIEAARLVGARAMIVHAIDEEAAAFYEPYGFRPFPAGSRTLFLPVETILAAL